MVNKQDYGLFQETPASSIPSLVSTLRQNYAGGETLNVDFRIVQLKQLAYMIQDNTEMIKAALRADLGRNDQESDLVEVSLTLADVLDAVENVKAWSKDERPSVKLQFKFIGARILKKPKGVSLIISAWNYPFALSLQPLIGAIAAGCPAVLKPSEVATATAACLATLIPKYLDGRFYQVVNGGIDVTTKLLEEPWGLAFYTGNGTVGKIVATACAKTLTPVLLELGGKSPVVIDENADLATAARRILWGKSVNAGQTCIAPDYVLCPESKQDDLVDAFKVAYKTAFPEGAKPGSMSTIINERHFSRLEDALSGTSGQIVVGGTKFKDSKLFSPTIVRDVKPDDELMKSEIFGPILPIIPVKNKEEAVNYINSQDNPLSLYVFTPSRKFRDWIFNKTSSGSCVANDVMFQNAVNELPFGGAGPSGSGSYHGKKSFDAFTHERSSIDVPGWMDLALAARYLPYSPSKAKQLAILYPSIPFPRPGQPTPTMMRLKRNLKWILLLGVLALGSWQNWLGALPRYTLVRMN